MEALFEGLLGTRVGVACEPIADHTATLPPAERDAIATARPSRQHEFATGRRLARQLLEAFGHPAALLERGPDRTPRWPAGIVGSITHSGPLCAVAVARTLDVDLLGIDLERDAPVREGIVERVCLPDEERWIEVGDPIERGRRCRVIFSAKEAVYKAFHPRLARVWRFHDVRLAIDLAAERFEARLPEDAGQGTIGGRVRRRAGWIACAVGQEVGGGSRGGG